MDLLILSISLLLTILQPVQSANPKIIQEEGIARNCPSQEKRDAAILTLQHQLNMEICKSTQNVDLVCGTKWPPST